MCQFYITLWSFQKELSGLGPGFDDPSSPARERKGSQPLPEEEQPKSWLSPFLAFLLQGL